MKIKDGRITFLFQHDGATIDIEDREANALVVRIKLNQEQVCQMLSRLGFTKCESTEFFNLDKIGKTHSNKTFEFELPECEYNERKQCALETIKDICPKGWVSDNHFDSRDSFFKKDDRWYARVTIRKWE